MKNQLHIKLESMLASYVPLSILKPEYVKSLSSKVITNDESNRFVRNSDIAEFMLSPERTAIDKNQLHKSLQRSDNDAGDSQYIDVKGKI